MKDFPKERLAQFLNQTALLEAAPAVRASGVKPAIVRKGGNDPHSRRRLMHALVAAQVAFCFMVLFVGGLFITTYKRLATQPTGFSTDRLRVLNTVTASPQPPVFWSQVAAHLRTVPGVETVALANRTLLNDSAWNGFLFVSGDPPGNVQAFFRAVSPGWIDVMKIPLLDGRDFVEADAFPNTAIVNETFARTYFGGENPIGKWFSRRVGGDRIQIVGLVRDARYRNMRDSMLPTAFFPFRAKSSKDAWEPRSQATFLVRTSAQNSLALASALRQEVHRAHSGFRVSALQTQHEVNDAHTVRERLLALLALFFAFVALLLAAVGLYGVLDYSVLQQRREIGIRMALGVRASDVVRQVTLHSIVMVFAGALAGLILGLTWERYIQTLLYGVKTTEPAMLAMPIGILLTVALLAVTPSAMRDARIDPAKILRADLASRLGICPISPHNRPWRHHDRIADRATDS